jgi:hypothetical protein
VAIDHEMQTLRKEASCWGKKLKQKHFLKKLVPRVFNESRYTCLEEKNLKDTGTIPCPYRYYIASSLLRFPRTNDLTLETHPLEHDILLSTQIEKFKCFDYLNLLKHTLYGYKPLY